MGNPGLLPPDFPLILRSASKGILATTSIPCEYRNDKSLFHRPGAPRAFAVTAGLSPHTEEYRNAPLDLRHSEPVATVLFMGYTTREESFSARHRPMWACPNEMHASFGGTCLWTKTVH